MKKETLIVSVQGETKGQGGKGAGARGAKEQGGGGKGQGGASDTNVKTCTVSFQI